MRSGGPQSERDRRFWDEKADVPGIVRSDLVVNDGDEKRAYEGELSRIRRENTSLKDQLQRSLRELKVYQIKYPSAYAPSEGEEDLPPWTTRPEVMTPLLQAYDSRIKELEDIVGQQSVELEIFREKMENVLAENEELRQAQLERLRQHQDRNLGPMGPLNAELLAEMNERVEILMEENALMLEQKAKLSSTLDDLQEELASRTLELSAVVQHLKGTERELMLMTARLEQAEKDREEAAGQTVGYSEELGSARSNVDTLREQLSVWQAKAGDADMVIREIRKQLSFTAAQAEENNLLNMRRTKSAEDRVRDLHSLLLQKTLDLDSALEVGRKLRREYHSTRQDAEGMLQVMGGLERQVADYHEREEEVQRLARESKQKVEDALSLKDQAAAREDHSQREVGRLMEERGLFLLKRQADVDAASEVTRQRAAAQRRSCEEDMKELSLKNADLIVNTEKALRDSQSGREQMDRMARIRESERKTVDSHMTELEGKIGKTVIGLEEEKARRVEVQEVNKDLRFTIDKLRAQMDASKVQQQQSDRAREAEIQALKGPLRDAQRLLMERARELSKRTKELEDIRGSNETYLASIERRYGEETALYRKRSVESNLLRNEMDLLRTQGDQHALLVVEEIKTRSMSTQKLLEGRLREEAELARRLALRNRDSDAALRDATEERTVFVTMLEEARGAITQLSEELSDARGAVADLTSQLSSSYDARASTARLLEDMGHSHISAFEETKGRDRDYVDSIIQGGIGQGGMRRSPRGSPNSRSGLGLGGMPVSPRGSMVLGGGGGMGVGGSMGGRGRGVEDLQRERETIDELEESF